MGDTGANLVTAVLWNLGNLDLTTHGPYVVDKLNDTLLDYTGGPEFADFRTFQRTQSVTAPVSTGSIQTLAFSLWGADVWAPLAWHDLTLDELILPVDIETLDQLSGSAASQIAAYALWGNNLVISPALSVTKNIQLRYLSSAAKPFVWDGGAGIVTGSSTLPTNYDEGLKLGATRRYATLINPALQPLWYAQEREWRRTRVSEVDAQMLLDSDLRAEPTHLGLNY
jgi:hypothetical protein